MLENSPDLFILKEAKEQTAPRSCRQSSPSPPLPRPQLPQRPRWNPAWPSSPAPHWIPAPSSSFLYVRISDVLGHLDVEESLVLAQVPNHLFLQLRSSSPETLSNWSNALFLEEWDESGGYPASSVLLRGAHLGAHRGCSPSTPHGRLWICPWDSFISRWA